jgi:hypothetical protein
VDAFHPIEFPFHAYHSLVMVLMARFGMFGLGGAKGGGPVPVKVKMLLGSMLIKDDPVDPVIETPPCVEKTTRSWLLTRFGPKTKDPVGHRWKLQFANLD